ncbi:MAG: HAD family hydrolase [Anaerolineae bacterium]|nr:HAD family hydrolase [Anaerolineae bacterium]
MAQESGCGRRVRSGEAGGPSGMVSLQIPGWGHVDLSAVVLDLNGTVTVDGEVIPGVAKRILALQGAGMTCYLLTADTRGLGAATAAALGVVLERLQGGDEAAKKAAFVRRVGAERVFAVGNGANDAEMLRAAAVGVAVLQAEGTSVAALEGADLVVPGIDAALDLLLEPQRLVATLRR